METPKDPPHFGKILNSHVRRNRYHQSSLARSINVSPYTVADFLKKPDNKLSHIWRICYALRYNFLADLAAQLPAELPSKPSAKDERIADLEAQLKEMTTERDVLQRVIEVLKT